MSILDRLKDDQEPEPKQKPPEGAPKKPGVRLGGQAAAPGAPAQAAPGSALKPKAPQGQAPTGQAPAPPLGEAPEEAPAAGEAPEEEPAGDYNSLTLATPRTIDDLGIRQVVPLLEQEQAAEQPDRLVRTAVVAMKAVAEDLLVNRWQDALAEGLGPRPLEPGPLLGGDEEPRLQQ